MIDILAWLAVLAILGLFIWAVWHQAEPSGKPHDPGIGGSL